MRLVPSESTRMKPALIRAAAARVLHAYGNDIQLHLTSGQTDGAVTMFTDITPPQGGPPPHFHVGEDEWWFVLDGQAEFFNGDQWTAVAPGGAVFMPKHSLHTFRNPGQSPLRQIIHTAPAGFETFITRSAEVFQAGGEPDFDRLRTIATEAGIFFPTLFPGDAERRGVPTLSPVIRQPADVRALHAFGEEVRILLSGTDTGGQFTAFVETTPPGGGPPPHFHEREHEWFYILDGTVSFLLGGTWMDAHRGDVVFAPRESVHTFKNNTASPTRMLIHTAPSGFETFFAEEAEEFAKPGGPDMNRAIAIAGKYGIRFVPA